VALRRTAARLLEDTEVWVPLTFIPNDEGSPFPFPAHHRTTKRGGHSAQAQADLDAVSMGLERQYPGFKKTWRLRLFRCGKNCLETFGRDSMFCLARRICAVDCVRNIANLLLARAAGRQKEIAIAVRWAPDPLRLIRQLLMKALCSSQRTGQSDSSWLYGERSCS